MTELATLLRILSFNIALDINLKKYSEIVQKIQWNPKNASVSGKLYITFQIHKDYIMRWILDLTIINFVNHII